MTHKEYDKFTEELKRRGYRKYPSPRGSKDDWAWFKPFGKSAYKEDRSNYQVCFDVADFSSCAGRENISYGINSLILISRTVDERVDLHLSHIKVDDQNIDEIERLAESFYRWAEKEMKV